MKKQVIALASRSPRRRELLSIAGFMFNTISIDVDETPLPNESVTEYTLRVSAAKARAAVPLVRGDALILAADTTVYDGKIIGKPDTAADAEKMLKNLRERTHQVYTAISVLDPKNDRLEQEIAETDVPMRDYSDEEIGAYIQSGDPLDKAGAYGIQNALFHPAETRTGCYANVIGLPLCHLLKILRRMDQTVEQDIPYLCQNAHDYQCGVFTAILR